MANELQAEGLVLGAELQTVGLGLPPALPADVGFCRNGMRFLQQRPALLELPFKDVVQQGAIGTACRKRVVQRL